MKNNNGWKLPPPPNNLSVMEGTFEDIIRRRRMTILHGEDGYAQESPKSFLAVYLDETELLASEYTAHLHPNIKLRLAFITVTLDVLKNIVFQTLSGGVVGYPSYSHLLSLIRELDRVKILAHATIMSYTGGELIRENEIEVNIDDEDDDD